MATLEPALMRSLLQPYDASLPEDVLGSLSIYLDLLVRWNAKTNLTAIRDPQEMVRRHFGESLFLARHLPECTTLLDLGSGAGFPGLPVQLVLPSLRVTLAESQNKKATFLREVVRTLGLKTEVWASRVETMPVDRRFDVVALRAVDQPELALELARAHLAPGGVIAHLTSGEGGIAVPGSTSAVLRLVR